MSGMMTLARRHLPLLDLALYYRAARRHAPLPRREMARRFGAMLEAVAGRRALQIGVRDAAFGAGWTTVDLHDRSPLIDCGMDVQRLAFADATFDAVACNAVLECVPDPARAIAELGRVLRPGGRIWVEMPFIQAHHPSSEQGWRDYWRVSVDGLRVWMQDFELVDCGVFGSALWNGVYYHGRKPLPELVVPAWPAAGAAVPAGV